MNQAAKFSTLGPIGGSSLLERQTRSAGPAWPAWPGLAWTMVEREARVVLSRAGLGLSPRGKMGTAGGLQV